MVILTILTTPMTHLCLCMAQYEATSHLLRRYRHLCDGFATLIASATCCHYDRCPYQHQRHWQKHLVVAGNLLLRLSPTALLTTLNESGFSNTGPGGSGSTGNGDGMDHDGTGATSATSTAVATATSIALSSTPLYPVYHLTFPFPRCVVPQMVSVSHARCSVFTLGGAPRGRKRYRRTGDWLEKLNML
jgi:hypothetical protein